MRLPHSSLATVLAVLAVAAACLAQVPPVGAGGAAVVPADAAEPSEMIQLNFPENLPVRTLIQYVSARLGMNIVYDDAVGAKRVNLVAPARIPRESLLGLLESVLAMSELSLVESDQPGWWRVVPARDLVSITRAIEQDGDALAHRPATAPLMQVFTLQHASPAAVQRTIQPLLTRPGGNLFTLDAQTLVVTDLAGNLRRVAAIIEMMDRPRPEVTVQFVQLQHVEAAEMSRQVAALLREKHRLTTPDAAPAELTLTPEPRTGRLVLVGSPRAAQEALGLIGELDVPLAQQVRRYRLRYVAPQRIDRLGRDLAGPGAGAAYRSTIDAESGMLIVTAGESLHARLAELIDELDVAEAQVRDSHVQFYKLMNTSAAHVLATIRTLEGGDAGLGEVRQDDGPTTPAPAGGELATAGGNPHPPGPVAAAASVPVEAGAPATVSPAAAAAPQAPARQAVRLRDAVVTADVNTNTIIVSGPPEVQRVYRQMIQMLDRRRPQVLVEVTLLTLDTSGGYSVGVELARGGEHGDDGRWLLFSAFGLSKLDPATAALSLMPGVGFNGVLVGPDQLNIILRAVATDSRSRVLSAPRVLVNDNATAMLASVSESPFTSLNVGQTVSTVSFAGYASAGTTITLTPRIAEGQHLHLNYSISLNSFTGESGEGIPPPRQTNTLSSEVTVPNGHAVIIGGLTREDSSRGVTKIPILGDIPLLGHAFRNQSGNRSQSTLFVFLRPIILRDDEFADLRYLSDRALADAGLAGNYPPSKPMLMTSE